jgi:hypothetical protein
MSREETFVVSTPSTTAMVYAQALESRIKAGWAGPAARTAKSKISKALHLKKNAILLTGDELAEVIDAASSLFENVGGKYSAGIVLEGEGKPMDVLRTTPYPAIKEESSRSLQT